MFTRNGACQSLPALQAGGNRLVVFAQRHDPRGHHTSRGRRAWNEQELRTVERGQRWHDRVPSILANNYGHPAPARVERLHAASRVHEPPLVKHSVGREKHLAMNVEDLRLVTLERGVESRIVNVILE